ncbi:hypothetical protein [Marinobacter sp. ELB17]|uniref:DUF7167 family protein n=1 Tax=Marinobacter sp. ELB17 TaxID=270374 RepID=UPI0000F39C70|nr:hypothetical protein [Marinobacter sp. ELB17]EAZ97241.1 hypothetical protein MELB17_10128 [Marinobacter sp. ELB17]
MDSTVKIKYLITDRAANDCTNVIEFDRSEWNAMTPGQREDSVKAAALECSDWHWDETEEADTADLTVSEVITKAPSGDSRWWMNFPLIPPQELLEAYRQLGVTSFRSDVAKESPKTTNQIDNHTRTTS